MKGHPKYLPRKEVYSFRTDSEDLKKLKAYAKLKGIEPTRVVIRILHEFLEDKVVVNDFLPDELGFVLPLLTDVELKKKTINKDISGFMDEDNLTKWLNRHTENKLIGTASYETDQIPNNLDLWTGDTFESTKEGIDHEGILLVIVPQIFRDNYKVTANDLLYFLDIQVVADQYNITPITPMTAINKLRLNHRFELIVRIQEITDRLRNVLREYNKTQNDKKCMEKLQYLASEYNKGEVRDRTIELDDTVTINDESEPREVVMELLMKTDVVQGMADEIMENKELMSKIQQLLNNEK